MSEKKEEHDSKKFLIQIILFIVALFVVWVISERYKENNESDKPFIVPHTDPLYGGKTFGPENLILSPDHSEQGNTTGN